MTETRDAKRARVRAKLVEIENETLEWERFRVAAQSQDDRDRALEQLALLRRRYDRERARMVRLQDQLTFPWFGRKERKVGS